MLSLSLVFSSINLKLAKCHFSLVITEFELFWNQERKQYFIQCFFSITCIWHEFKSHLLQKTINFVMLPNTQVMKPKKREAYYYYIGQELRLVYFGQIDNSLCKLEL